MAIVRFDYVVQTAQGQAIAGAQVYFLTQPADVDTLTPLAQVYSSLGGAAAPNPQVTDGLGHVGCYLDNGQLYTIVVVAPEIVQQVYPDQALTGGGGSGYTPVACSSAAGTITGAINGTNRVFVLPSVPAAGSLIFQYNSRVLTAGQGYTINGATVTMANAPQTGDSLAANYLT